MRHRALRLARNLAVSVAFALIAVEVQADVVTSGCGADGCNLQELLNGGSIDVFLNGTSGPEFVFDDFSVPCASVIDCNYRVINDPGAEPQEPLDLAMINVTAQFTSGGVQLLFSPDAQWFATAPGVAKGSATFFSEFDYNVSAFGTGPFNLGALAATMSGSADSTHSVTELIDTTSQQSLGTLQASSTGSSTTHLDPTFALSVDTTVTGTAFHSADFSGSTTVSLVRESFFVPEPSSVGLLATGFALIGLSLGRRR